MSSQLQAALPTLDSLKVKLSDIHSLKDDRTRVTAIAEEWIKTFNSVVQSPSDALERELGKILIPNSWWRDNLALTWDIRTFYTLPTISHFLSSQLPKTGFGDVILDEGTGRGVSYVQNFEDLVWIQVFVKFKTKIGEGEGVIRLVPIPSSSESKIQWKAYTIFTSLTSLSSYPPLLGPHRNPKPNHGQYPSARLTALNFLDREPAVVVIGAGQSGIGVAARLGVMGVDTLVVEKKENVGQQWRDRYEALCLHDPVWYDHMPYIPFPETWPAYTPAPKLADWLKSYAESMELNVWTNSEIVSCKRLPSNTWELEIIRRGGSGEAYGKRIVRPRRIVFAIGIASNVPNVPTFKGQELFKGKIVHSTDHDSAKNWIGKKALVIGACTSAHDIAADFHHYSVPVTMHQRSPTYIMSTKNGWGVSFAGTYCEGGPPTHVADLISQSFPRYAVKEVEKRVTGVIKELDRGLLKGLEEVGFMLTDGIDGSGFPQLAWNKAGGYYFDVGTSQLIASKKIKLVSKTTLSHFTETSAVFEDGREVECDIVVCATGLGNGRDPIKRILNLSSSESGPGSNLTQIYGLNEEGEMKGIYTDTGVEDVWVMMGNLALCRFYSSSIALQIKALEEGIWDGKRYGK